MSGDFYDPEQHTWAELLQHDFLARVAEVEPRVLKGLHKKVLPPYRDLPTDNAKGVGRILEATRAIIESRRVEPWEFPSAILASLPPTHKLTTFQAAFDDWYTEFHLLDTWAHDEALYCLSAWILLPETETLTPLVRRKPSKVPRYRWFLLDAPRQPNPLALNRWSPPDAPAGARVPAQPPKLDMFDELNERWESYRSRMKELLEQYWEDVCARAHGPPYSDILTKELRGGLVPTPLTRKGAGGDPLVWVVRHQVMRRTYGEIAEWQQKRNKTNTPKKGTVGERVRVLSREMRLSRPRPGGVWLST